MLWAPSPITKMYEKMSEEERIAFERKMEELKRQEEERKRKENAPRHIESMVNLTLLYQAGLVDHLTFEQQMKKEIKEAFGDEAENIDWYRDLCK